MRQDGKWLHIYPMSEKSEHDFETEQCSCKPSLKEEGFVIHQTLHEDAKYIETLLKAPPTGKWCAKHEDWMIFYLGEEACMKCVIEENSPKKRGGENA